MPELNQLDEETRGVRDLWQVIGARDELIPARIEQTRVLGEALEYCLSANDIRVWRAADTARTPLPMVESFGYFWVCLGEPAKPLFTIPEFNEPDRQNLNAATVGVHVSAPRAIENFLDMGHFPFVHTDILGVEPHTEVKDYRVEVTDDELLATECRFFQPMAAATSSGGADVDYVYRVPHPYCSVLYKSSGADPSRMDVIALFVQPVTHESCRANMLLSLIDEQHDAAGLRNFQLTIFGQDKPILENQVPKRLPLTPGAEVPIRADGASINYRRWLSQHDVRYGVIPATSAPLAPQANA
jgi:phenylpropionate dioxygenase-like ring-hydroxylating dioxygenase large terminal subunit